MSLPLLLSVPHAGLRVPEEALPYCILTPREIEEDGDVGAREIYELGSEVEQFVSTDVARAIIDLNRSVDDRRKDGVVKTHTCWNVPVYREPLSESVIQTLLERYYHPYHRLLTEAAGTGVKLGVDGHTMAAHAPPIGPDAGSARPRVCLSNADGTCPSEWIESLQRCFEKRFGTDVRINDPFQGGYITRTHSREIPWVQVELSRAPFFTASEKRQAVLDSLREFCSSVLQSSG